MHLDLGVRITGVELHDQEIGFGETNNTHPKNTVIRFGDTDLGWSMSYQALVKRRWYEPKEGPARMVWFAVLSDYVRSDGSAYGGFAVSDLASHLA